jgi:TolA-binding protein
MKWKVLILALGVAFGVAHAADVQETKEKVQKDFEQKYESLKTQVHELQEKAKTTSGAAKNDMDSQIQNLKKDEAELEEKIQKMKTSSGQA